MALWIMSSYFIFSVTDFLQRWGDQFPSDADWEAYIAMHLEGLAKDG